MNQMQVITLVLSISLIILYIKQYDFNEATYYKLAYINLQLEKVLD